MPLETEVANLTTQTTALLQAVNTAKVTLDNAVNAAAGSATSAAASTATAVAKSDQALAVFGTAAGLNSAQQFALTQVASAVNQVSLAAGYAASAASVAQQDLSGVVAHALHRGGTVTAMFIDDASKHSDGGAWIERVQHASWMNQPLNGKWLGWRRTELDARTFGGTLGAERVVNGTFSNNDTANWLTNNNPTFSVSDGVLSISSSSGAQGLYQDVPTEVGKLYRVTANFTGSVIIGYYLGSSFATPLGSTQLIANSELSFYASTTTTRIYAYCNSGNSGTIDNISVKEVTSLANSGDYYGLISDGKTYRLWRNLLPNTGFAGAVAGSPGTAPTGWSHNGVGGTLGISGDALTLSTAGPARQFIDSGTITLAAGQTATVSVDVVAVSGSAADQIVTVNTASSITGTTSLLVSGGTGRKTMTFTAGSAGASFSIRLGVGPSGNTAGAASATIREPQVQLGPVFDSYELKTVADRTQTETFVGNSRKHPRLISWIGEAGWVTGYDLTTPGWPMWRRIRRSPNGQTIGAFWPNNSTNVINNVSSLSAINGVLYIATNGSSAVNYGGLHVIDFVRDAIERVTPYGTADILAGTRWGLNVAQVNDNLVMPFQNLTRTIVGGAVQCVATTVMPDAPIDQATLVQMPTVAVHTMTGVSVLKHDGTVSSHAFTGSGSDTVAFVGDALAYTSANTSFAFQLAKVAAMTGATFTSSFLGSATAVSGIGTSLPSVTGGRMRMIPVRRGNTNQISWVRTGDTLNVAQMIRGDATGTYNTGAMSGDIRRALLIGTSVGAVEAGPELVTNGTFNTDLTGWTASNSGTGSSQWNAAGYMELTGVDTSNRGRRVQAVPTVPGKQYIVTFDKVAGTALMQILASNAAIAALDVFGISALGTYRYQFVAGSASTDISINCYGNGTVGVDNVSIKECVADRSYKARPQHIFGTLTAAPVAAGAQAAIYSGFSAANYLQEPVYSADLDLPLTGSTVSAWASLPATLPISSFPVIGTDILAAANGNFNSGSANWTVSNADATHVVTFDGSTMRYQSDTVSPVLSVASTVNLTLGKFYKVTVVTSARGGGALKCDGLLGPSGSATSFGNAVGTEVFIARSVTNSQFVIVRNTANTDVTLDSISIEEVDIAVLVDRSAATGAFYRLGVNPDGKWVGEVGDGTTTRRIASTQNYLGVQCKPRINITDTTLSMSVNGVSAATPVTGTALTTLTNTNAVLTIGNARTLDAPFPGSAMYVKIGGTAPSAVALAWVYEMEKFMFMPGAQITLPDSTSVADIAYDETLDNVHGCTATNEFIFSGFVRVASMPVTAGTATRVRAQAGVKLLARTGTNVGVDLTMPALSLRSELASKTENAARIARVAEAFHFVATNDQKVFPLPPGFTAVDVSADRLDQYEGADFTRAFDGFVESPTFTVGRATGIRVRVLGRRVA